MGGAAAGGGSYGLDGSVSESVCVFLCVVHTVTRTFAQLLTGQITGLLHHGQFDTF